MKTPDESWRLFIAIELPASLRQTVKQHIDRLRQAVQDARASWTHEENLFPPAKQADPAVGFIKTMWVAWLKAMPQQSNTP